MSRWMSGSPNHNGNGFPHMNDPSSAMMDPYIVSPAQFNISQFPTQSLVANGAMRNASPSAYPANPHSHPIYPTNSVVPSKRPREDGVSESPRPNPNLLPVSQSGTPPPPPHKQHAYVQQFASMSQQHPNSAHHSPSPTMSHQIRQVPPQVPHRMSTASPSPFSPGLAQFAASHGSPPPSERGTPQPQQYMPGLAPAFTPNYNQSTSPAPYSMHHQQQQNHQNPQPLQHPQNPQQHLLPVHLHGQSQGQQQQHKLQNIVQPQLLNPIGQTSPQMGQTPNNNMHPPPMQHVRGGATPLDTQRLKTQQLQTNSPMQTAHVSQVPPQSQPQQMQQQQQQQLHQTRAAQGRGMIPKQGMPMPIPMSMPNGQAPPPGAIRLQQPPRPTVLSDQELTIRLKQFMESRHPPLDPNPHIEDKSVPLLQLHAVVRTSGGFNSVSENNLWPIIAGQFGFNVQQVPWAPVRMRELYQRNLLEFDLWMMQRKAHQVQGQVQSHGQGQSQGQGQGQGQGMGLGMGMGMGMSMPPAHGASQRHMPQGMIDRSRIMQFSQANPAGGFQTPGKQPLPPHAAPNGYQLPHPSHGTPGSLRPTEPSPRGGASLPSPVNHLQFNKVAVGSGQPLVMAADEKNIDEGKPRSDIYSPKLRMVDTWGGLDFSPEIRQAGEYLSMLTVDVPRIHILNPNDGAPPVRSDLGNIDIAALTRSLESGIRGEVRMALDTLATVTAAPQVVTVPSSRRLLFIELEKSEDLLEALLGVAEEQVETLAEHTTEVSDGIQFTPYEELTRLAKIETYDLQPYQQFGSPEWELDKTVDTLGAVMIILRNLSFPPAFVTPAGVPMPDNSPMLADESVVNLLCLIIRYLGTRTMLLRTHRNTLEFMKDAVTLLSNTTHAIKLPGREQALCLLQLLISFAPCPQPSTIETLLCFPSYDPAIHMYLPPAVDSLAKLLARDEPNRSHFRVLFGPDAGHSAPHELLTRAYALAIAPIPDLANEAPSIVEPRGGGGQSRPLIEMRKPFLLQGLLAAEILVGLAPGPETGVVRAWAAAGSGHAAHLTAMTGVLMRHFERPPPRNPGVVTRRDPDLVALVRLAYALLKRVAEKSILPGNEGGEGGDVVSSLVPSTEKMLNVLLTANQPDWVREGVLTQFMGLALVGDSSPDLGR